MFVFVIVVVADLINDFVVVVVDPRSLPLKFGDNMVYNNWDILAFGLCGWVVGGDGGENSFSCKIQHRLCYVEM